MLRLLLPSEDDGLTVDKNSLAKFISFEKWVQFKIPVHKTHSGVVIFDQGLYFGWGRNFGLFPNGEDAWRSLHGASAGIAVQEIMRRYPRYP